MGCKRVGEAIYHVESETRPGTTYTVSLRDRTCQCRAFTHSRRRGELCKHIGVAIERCQEVTREKAASIPDVTIDELACRYEHSRPEIAEVLYDEIRRRGAEALQPAALPLTLTAMSDEQRRAVFA